MTVDVAATLAGLFFWLIIATNFASSRFGYQTFGDLESEASLQEIAQNPRRFKTGFALIIIEHLSIISLAATLFIAFRRLNVAFAVVWLVSRGSEGVIQIVEKRSYWRLLEAARRFSGAKGDERSEWAGLRVDILRSKRATFLFAQILFAVGTLSYSLLFAIQGVVPPLLAWFGVAAAVLYGFGSGLTIRNRDFRAVWNIGGLCILIFEAVLGGWLLFS